MSHRQMQTKEREMFGKSRDSNDQLPSAGQQPHRPAPSRSGESSDQASTISRGMAVVGKIFGEGTLRIFGHVEGELRALNIMIDEGATVEGNVVAEELTIGGHLKGVVRASRVKLNSTAVVEGDIFHQSLSIEENARFEGSSKREDNVVDVPLTQAKRSAAQDELQTKIAAIDSGRTSNGSSTHDEHHSVGAS
jgi:cytoskeletal protein CcmA (bactofilin family)